jgi:tRNA threonylcarbamoyladenosine biosynthesis protein TsaB
MRVLAIDTTGHFGSLALTRDGAIVEEVLLHSPEGFSTTLFEHIRLLLERHGTAVHDIDCFAAAAGPGSFTGVRVGLAAVKGLAEATGRRVAAVSNLKALAALGTGPLRAVLIDARRGEVYGAVYDAGLQPVRDEVVMAFPRWLETLPDGVEFLSTGIAPFAAALAGTRFAGATVSEHRALATAIASIAEKTAADPAAVDANYVRRSDAELLWKDR